MSHNSYLRCLHCFQRALDIAASRHYGCPTSPTKHHEYPVPHSLAKLSTRTRELLRQYEVGETDDYTEEFAGLLGEWLILAGNKARQAGVPADVSTSKEPST